MIIRKALFIILSALGVRDVPRTAIMHAHTSYENTINVSSSHLE